MAVEAQDAVHIVPLHHRDVKCVTSRELPPTEEDGARAVDVVHVDREPSSTVAVRTSKAG